jgi:hypothetical protein
MNIEFDKVGMEYWRGYEVGDIRTAILRNTILL